MKNKMNISKTKIISIVKIATISLAILTASIAAAYFNIEHQIELDKKQDVIREQIEHINRIEVTANIIQREGKISQSTAKKYASWIYEASEKYSVDPYLIMSIMYIESKFNHMAVSPTGPIGLFQIAYSYHKEKTTRANLFDPKNNIFVGARIIKEYADKSKSTKEALLRYNGSLGTKTAYANKVLAKKLKFEREIYQTIKDV